MKRLVVKYNEDNYMNVLLQSSLYEQTGDSAVASIKQSVRCHNTVCRNLMISLALKHVCEIHVHTTHCLKLFISQT